MNPKLYDLSRCLPTLLDVRQMIITQVYVVKHFPESEKDMMGAKKIS